MTDNPLAEGFLITDSSVEITVPKVPDGDYIIVCEWALLPLSSLC